MAKETKRVDKVDEEERFDFTLQEPINVFGDMVSVLKWRKPNGADLIRIGNPVVPYPGSDPIKIEHDMPKVIAMVARITDTPTSSLERMSTKDMVDWAWLLTSFFLPGG
jgi:hypothetical protein